MTQFLLSLCTFALVVACTQAGLTLSQQAFEADPIADRDKVLVLAPSKTAKSSSNWRLHCTGCGSGGKGERREQMGYWRGRWH